MAKKRPPKAPGEQPSSSNLPSQQGPGAKAAAGTKAEKLAAIQDVQRRRQRVRTGLQWGAGIVAVLSVLALFVYLGSREDESGDGADATASDPGNDLAGVETYEPDRGHVTGDVDYPQTPPAGGPHNPAWLNCGAYDTEVAAVNAVHSMEHGAVWITYQPDIPATDLAELTARLPDTYVVLSPFSGLPTPVVASAWGKQLQLTGVDDERLEEFVRTYRQGAQTPEPGAPCTGGVDETGRLDDGTLMP